MRWQENQQAKAGPLYSPAPSIRDHGGGFPSHRRGHKGLANQKTGDINDSEG